MHILLRIKDTESERDRWLAALSAAMPDVTWHGEPQIPGSIADQVQIAVVANPLPGALQGFKNLRFVQSLWAGVDRLLSDDIVPEHLVIARMVDPALATAMAETALWATLSLHRGFFHYAAQQRAGLWQELPQRLAGDIHVTVLGLGEMGLAAARRLAGQGYAVTGWRLSDQPLRGRSGEPEILAVSGRPALYRLLSETDVVLNLLPLTDQTRGLLNDEFFGALKHGASVVNLGRGGHLVEDHLLAALSAGRVSHAVLDVFQAEPLPVDHAFWQHPRVTVLPHVAAITDPFSAAQVVARQIRAWQAGQPVEYRVDRGRGY
jgi:glyoxylate/hydroxypyruvate reductase A